jgi:TonB family protein
MMAASRHLWVLLMVAFVFLACAPRQGKEVAVAPEPVRDPGSSPTARYVPEPAGPLPEETAGKSLTAPRVTMLHSPKYPDAALETGMEGEVLVRVRISETGAVEGAEVVATTSEVFTRAAVEAARLSRFEPGMFGKEPIAFNWIIPFEFSLDPRREAALGGPDDETWKRQQQPDQQPTQMKDR